MKHIIKTLLITTIFLTSAAVTHAWSEEKPTCESSQTLQEREREESTSCPYFTQWMKRGDQDGMISKYQQEDGTKVTINEVAKLQTWLNTYFNTNLDVDGYYGKETDTAVHSYQQKHKQYIINPWVPKYFARTTGNFKSTSEWFANYLMGCIDPATHFDGDIPGTYQPFTDTSSDVAQLQTTENSRTITEYQCVGEEEKVATVFPTERRKSSKKKSTPAPVPVVAPFARISSEVCVGGASGDITFDLELKESDDTTSLAVGDTVTFDIMDDTTLIETITGNYGDDISTFTQTAGAPTSSITAHASGAVVDAGTITVSRKDWAIANSMKSDDLVDTSVEDLNIVVSVYDTSIATTNTNTDNNHTLTHVWDYLLTGVYSENAFNNHQLTVFTDNILHRVGASPSKQDGIFRHQGTTFGTGQNDSATTIISKQNPFTPNPLVGVNQPHGNWFFKHSEWSDARYHVANEHKQITQATASAASQTFTRQDWSNTGSTFNDCTNELETLEYPFTRTAYRTTSIDIYEGTGIVVAGDADTTTITTSVTASPLITTDTNLANVAGFSYTYPSFGIYTLDRYLDSTDDSYSRNIFNVVIERY